MTTPIVFILSAMVVLVLVVIVRFIITKANRSPIEKLIRWAKRRGRFPTDAELMRVLSKAIDGRTTAEIERLIRQNQSSTQRLREETARLIMAARTTNCPTTPTDRRTGK